jgi:hypothetical protein
MSPRDLADDLAYVRTIAEEGRQAPLLGGSFFIFWGVLNAVAWSAQWALLHGLLFQNPTWHFAVLWAGYGVIAGIGMAALGGRVRTLPGRSSVGNRVEAAAWTGAGIGIGATALGAIGRMAMTGDTLAVDVIAPAAFVLFGAALMITGMISKERWLSAYATLSYCLGLLFWLFLSADWFYLAAAGGATVTLLAPGLILLRKEPSTTV